MQNKVWFYNTKEEKLSGILFRPKGSGKFPGIIFCHGFTSSKYSKTSIAKKISKKGFVVLIFDSSGHGESEGDFKHYTVSKYASEIKNACDFLKKQKFVDPARIGVTGTSLGGMATVIYAAKHNPKAIVPVCAPTVLTKFIGKESLLQPEILKEWKKKGAVSFDVRIKNGKEPRLLSYKFIIDSKKHDLAKSVKKVKCPIIIVHGNADKNVLLKHAYILFKNAKSRNTPTEMVIAEGAPHTFKEKYEDVLVKIVINGFKKYL